MSCVMNGKELGEWGYIKAEFDGPKTLCDEARLLKDAVFEYARFNYDFHPYSNEPDFPFGWGELQNQGILFHSFYHALKKGNYKELILPEYPYTLNKYQYKRRKPPENRRIDLWISLRKGEEEKETVLLIEYKHIWMSVRKKYIYQDWSSKQDKPLKGVNNNSWKKDWEKLEDATKRQYQNNFIDNEMKISDIVKITFMTLIIHNESEKEEKIEPVNKKDFASHIKDIKLDPEQNWRAYWWLPKNLQKDPGRWDDNDGNKHWVYYRGLYFLATLDLISK